MKLQDLVPKTERGEAFLTTVDTQAFSNNRAQSEIEVSSMAESMIRLPVTHMRSQSVVQERIEHAIYIFADDQFIKATTACFKIDLGTIKEATIDDILESASQKMAKQFRSLYTL